MRVLHVVSGYPSNVKPAAGAFVREQTQALSRLGVEVVVAHMVPYAPAWLGYFSEKWKLATRMPTGISRDGQVTVARIPYLAFPREVRWGFPDRLMAAALRRARPQLGHSFDLIHAHFAFPNGAAALSIAKATHLPLIVTVHGSDANVYPGQNKAALQKFRQIMRGADGIISVSRALRHRIADLSGARAHSLPIGVDCDRFAAAPDKGEVKRRLGLDTSRNYLLFVGGLLRNKGVYELVDAFTSVAGNLPHLDLLIVGDGTERQGIHSKIIATRMHDRIRMVGAVAHDSIIEWMGASDALVLPSYTEGLPTVVVEAGAVGLPVIATRVGGIPEVVTHGESGLLIDRPDATQLGDQICRMFASAEAVRMMGANLRRFVWAEYNIMTNSEKLVRYYHEVLARRHPAGSLL